MFFLLHSVERQIWRPEETSSSNCCNRDDMLSSITAVYRTITFWNMLPCQENIISEFEQRKGIHYFQKWLVLMINHPCCNKLFLVSNLSGINFQTVSLCIAFLSVLKIPLIFVIFSQWICLYSVIKSPLYPLNFFFFGDKISSSGSLNPLYNNAVLKPQFLFSWKSLQFFLTSFCKYKEIYF